MIQTSTTTNIIHEIKVSPVDWFRTKLLREKRLDPLLRKIVGLIYAGLGIFSLTLGLSSQVN